MKHSVIGLIFVMNLWSAHSAAQEPSIFYSAMANDIGIARLYVTSGEPVNVRDKSGRTPLMLAAEHGNTKVLEYLLSVGADPNLTTDNGLRALDFTRSSEIKRILTHTNGSKN
ncbi:ankyrin repeat domain-containing protein [Thiobacillus sp.]|uniref:ankyrin repeat domain-containing protein n=1 Tax=Thiobacillus sp. TaxID=924 RepID=UPI0025D331F8|nr:ankyrin repeat domain-containing protein [Thiobacillus sp.]MBT9540015.1 ankyrin repeat domain-containing protein [Thiobacillus sp.]